jgi:hypothetical protein
MDAPAITGGSESLDVTRTKYPNWFSPDLHEFWGQREKLPFDQHGLLALCAPRPFDRYPTDAEREAASAAAVRK